MPWRLVLLRQTPDHQHADQAEPALLSRHLGVTTGDVVPGRVVWLMEPSERDCGLNDSRSARRAHDLR